MSRPRSSKPGYLRDRATERAYVTLALRPLQRLYGPTPAIDFGPLKLKTVRDEMIRLDWCRNTINRHVDRLKHVFKWAVGAELLPGEVHYRLVAIEPLQKNRSAARETPKVKAVPDAQVDAVLPFLSPQVRAMVELQRLTGARSGELCRMRTCDVDTSDKGMWIYRPPEHKTAHHDQVREIYIGPKARAILEPLLRPDVQAFIFSPAEAAGWHLEQRRKKRETPMTPSQLARAERSKRQSLDRERAPGDHYTPNSFAEAIERACDVAFAPPPELARGRVKTPRGQKQMRLETQREWRSRLGREKWAALLKWQKHHRWHPHQLRHSFASKVRREAGADMVGTLLGDRSPAMVAIYAERDEKAARRVVAKIG